MTRHRIAVIGLGMAVTPHAKSLLDLRDRVEVACAFSRSEARRQAFAERFDFPTTGDLGGSPATASIDAVMILTPPNTHLELVERFAARGQAHPAGEAARALDRAGAAPGRGGRGGGRQARRRVPAPLSRGLGASAARLGQRALGELAAVNVSCPGGGPELLRRARPRHARARRRRRPDHPGDPHPRSDAEPRRAGRRGRGDRRHDRPAPHGERGFRRRRPALCQRRAGRADGDHGRVPGLPGADRADRHQGTAILAAGVVTVHYQDGREERFGEEQGTGGGADPMAFPHDAHRALLTDFLDAIDRIAARASPAARR